MNILLINHYAGSLKHGMEFRPFYLSREWVKQGHNVTIIAASFSHLRKMNPDVDSNYSVENISGINYIWLKTPVYEENGIRRFLNILAFIAQIFRFVNKIIEVSKPDVVISSSTYPLDNFSAKYICRKTNSKHVFEVHDLWPLSPMELSGMSKYHPFIILTQLAENFACKHSHKIISILPNTKSHLQTHGMLAEKFAHVPNGINVEDWENQKPLSIEHQQIINQVKEKKHLIIGYAGGHGVLYSLGTLLAAAELLKNHSVSFILVGKGQEKNNLIEQTTKLKLKNVYFLSPIPKLSIPCFLKQMDVLFVSLQKQPLYRFGISLNKIFDYMMASKPIIYAGEASNDPVQESQAGISIDAESPEEISKAVSMLINLTVEERIAMGENGKKYVMQNHDYRILSKLFIEFISD